jgi:AraC family transcriptional regulator, ethanolamine operon transcriptional activator
MTLAMHEENARAHRFCAARREVTDAWQHSQSATDWSHLFEQLSPGPFNGSTHETWLGPVQIIHERLDQAFSYHGRSWEGSRVFVALLPAAGDLYFDDRLMPENLLVTYKWDAAGRAAGNGRVECVFVAVDEQFFARYAEQVLGHRLVSDVRHPLVLSAEPAVVARFRNTVLTLLQQVEQEPVLLSNEHSRRYLQDHVLRMLLGVVAPSGQCVDRLPRPSTRAYIVDRAVEFMDARLSQPVVPADICKALRVSPRTLRYSFEEIVGVSPMRYLLARRLNAARRDLMQQGAIGTVEEVAVRWGFWHMSRFAQFYRLTFGERPSETWRAARYSSTRSRVAHREGRLAAAV